MNKLATFAGGCFWCMVKPFDQYEGVRKVVSGYTGGHTEDFFRGAPDHRGKSYI